MVPGTNQDGGCNSTVEANVLWNLGICPHLIEVSRAEVYLREAIFHFPTDIFLPPTDLRFVQAL